jgi:ribokinase
MKTPRIAIAGSCNIDLTTFTDHFPRPGQTIFGRGFNLGFGGKGANQAVAARLCGAEVAMIARVGDDLFGPATVSNLEAFGIDTTHVTITPGASSGVAPILVDSSGENRIIVVSGANDLLSPADIDRAAEVLERSDMIVLQLEVPLETVYHTLRFARSRGIPAILNPAPAPSPDKALDLAAAAIASYVIPNETEAEALAGVMVRDLDSARECASTLLAAGLPRVILTLGANGALLAGAEGMTHVAAFEVQPFDTTGAGDAFIGSLARFLAGGCDELEAISRANLYAALSTLAAGTQKSFVTLERFEQEWPARRKNVIAANARE